MAGAGRSRAELLIFALADQRYALRAEQVRELLRVVALVPLPRAPRLVEGVIDLRGRLVPVLDIRGRFGLPRKAVEASDHLIVAEVNGRPLAIRVDRALDLVNVDLSEELAGDCVAGVARLADGLAVIHDLATFLETGERVALDEALSAAGAA